MTSVKVLNHYPYRKAWVRGTGVVAFPREMMMTFEKHLAQQAGVKPDNHTCYVVEMASFPENIVKTFMFTDLYVFMGSHGNLDVGNW